MANNLKKYKRGRSDKRRVYCTDSLDYLCWGDVEGFVVKGFMAVKEIQEINQGFGKNKSRIYVVAANRTLELEAKDTKIAKEWKAALENLMKSSKYEESKKKELLNSEEWKENKTKWEQEHTQLLVIGDVFKKWPGKKKLQKGKFTCRKIWSTPKLDRLSWGDIAQQGVKIKGFLSMDEIVQVQEDASDKLKFAIQCKERTLDLEGKSVWVREKWVRALRFYLAFRQKHAG